MSWSSTKQRGSSVLLNDSNQQPLGRESGTLISNSQTMGCLHLRGDNP